jgi:hypothetical protein
MSAAAGHNYFPLSAVGETYGSRIPPCRSIARTPSPTPSEIEALGGPKKKQEFTWKSMSMPMSNTQRPDVDEL